MKNVVQDLTSAGIDWQREKWQSGLGSKFIHQGEKNAAKYADEVIVLSKGVQDYFKETYGRETHFIPNGVNRPQIREASLITDKFGLKKDSYILFLGRLVPEKGIRYLVEAFKNVKTDKKLVIAGGSSDTDSFMEELKDLAKGDDRILFTGFVQGAMLDELDWWIASQWENMPTRTEFTIRQNRAGAEIKSHVYRALRRSNLKEMHSVRYADDFKIFCSSHTDAVKAYHATAKWLKDRLGLDISPEKSRIVNLKRQYSEFLGFKLKVQKRSNKYVVKSHMCDKAYKKVQKKLTEEVKKLEHSADDKAQFMQLMTYNAVVAGIHQYYCIATAVSEDFGKLAYGVKKQMHNRLRNDLTRKGELKKGYIKEKYGKSSQLRFLHGRPVVPIGYVQSRNAQHKRKSVNKYTPEGRELIHKNLNIDTKTMLWLMRNPVQGRSIEYADNRISLYAAQHGKCAVTGSIMEAHDIHCHHKRPAAKGGTDEYGNLVLISAPVHKLIHASDMATIKFYLNLLNLDSTQILKLNKFREMAEMPLID